MTSTLSQEQFLGLVESINSQLGPAATQLWHDGVRSEAVLQKLTKEDMQTAGVDLGSRVLIYEHYHPSGILGAHA